MPPQLLRRETLGVTCIANLGWFHSQAYSRFVFIANTPFALLGARAGDLVDVAVIESGIEYITRRRGEDE